MPGSIAVLQLSLHSNTNIKNNDNIIYYLGGLGLELFLIHQLVIKYVNKLLPAESFNIMAIIKVLICLAVSIALSVVYKTVLKRM